MTDLKQRLEESEQTGLTVCHVVDEILYTGLLEMRELDAPGYGQGRIVPIPSKRSPFNK